MGNVTVHMIGNAHIDAAWLWRWDETVQVVRDTFASALDRMEETPGFIFTCSQVVYFRWMEEQYPELFARIREEVAAGRWDLAGGWWVQPDCNIPGGESFIRQALYGQQYFEDRFGRRAAIGYNPDTFGHANTLPQILAGSGLRGYLFFRPGPHEKALENGVFWWQSPDGSRVLAMRPPHHYCTGEEELSERIRISAEQVPSPGTDVMCFYGVGDHGGGPTKRAIASIMESAAWTDGPRVKFSGINEAYDRAAAQEPDLPVVADELQHHAPGCYSVHSEVKRRNREMEQLLLEAEAFAALAQALGGPEYPGAELAQAWMTTLFNQFHDVLAGTSIPEVYEDANEMYEEAEALAMGSLEPSLGFLASCADTQGEGTAIVVFNPLSWARTAPVQVEIPWTHKVELLSVTGPDGEAVPMQIDRASAPTSGGTVRLVFLANVPALGHAVYRCAPGAPAEAEAVHARPESLENEFLRVEIDAERGVLRRILDKRTQTDLLAQPGAELIVIQDWSDTWSHSVTAYRDEIGRFGAAQVRVLECGPVRGVVRIDTSYGSSQAQTDLVLWRGAARLEGHVTLDWHEQHCALKLGFPLALSDVTATYETPYGHIARPADGEEEPGQQWIDLSGTLSDGRRAGMALLNDCKYGFDIKGAEMRMTVLRSPIYAFHDPKQIDSQQVYRYIDQGVQDFTWAIVPHSGDFRAAGVVEQARELNMPPSVFIEAAHPGPLGGRRGHLTVSPEGVHVGALKLAEDGDGYIVRLAETRGRETAARVELPFLHARIECRLGPLQIRTFRVPAGGGPVETNLIEDDLSS